MRGLSLFSGIGGLDLAAEWAGIEPVSFCEIEPYAQKVLKKRWPDVPIIEDVRKITQEGVSGLISKNDKYKHARPLEWHKSNMPIERKEVMPDGSHETIDIVYGGFPQ